ncbi:hypothetical protein PG997_008722 [Apiospora hydei]|uniref:F-box domain-containing protein n=1 Tax=Apiospora hydei TaxID=1337664 RepID=A0ABR1WBL7_9PEZI
MLLSLKDGRHVLMELCTKIGLSILRYKFLPIPQDLGSPLAKERPLRSASQCDVKRQPVQSQGETVWLPWLAKKNSKNRQAASKAHKSDSAVKTNVFPDRIPQEVLDGILIHLHTSDIRNLAASCKNLHEGVLPTLYHHRTEPALLYAARNGRVETLKRVKALYPTQGLDLMSFDIIPGGPGSLDMWPQDLPPRTTPLILSIVHGHPTMAKALLEAGADKVMQGGSQVFLPSGRLLRPIEWLLEQMHKTTCASTQKQWKAVLEIILPVSFVYPDSGQRRQLSPLGQSIHPNIPVEITRMLIKKGNLGKEHMFAPFQYELNNKKTMSAYALAKQERDQEDPNSSGGYGRARLAMLRRIVYKKGTSRRREETEVATPIRIGSYTWLEMGLPAQ